MPRKDSEFLTRAEVIDRFADAHRTAWQIPEELIGQFGTLDNTAYSAFVNNQNPETKN
jgi:hypothetical protein